MDTGALSDLKRSGSVNSSTNGNDNDKNNENRLYDREKERQILVDRFEAVHRGTRKGNELVLVTGPSGTGKTALCMELCTVVNEKSGFFIKGKLDQLQTRENNAAFVDAFSDFLGQYLNRRQQNEDEESVRQKRLGDKLRDVTGGNPDALVRTIPALSQLFQTTHSGKESTSPTAITTTAADAMQQNVPTSQSSVHRMLCKFVSAISSKEEPIVLLLDDLQWAGRETVDLLSELLTEKTIEGFMIVATCRGNEVSFDDDLSKMLRELEDGGDLIIVEIPLSNLTPDAVSQLVADQCSDLSLDPSDLSAVLHARTNGNAFFVQRLLWHIKMTATDHQSLDVKIQGETESMQTTHVETVITLEILELDLLVQEILKVASCLGAVSSYEHLLACVPDSTEGHLLIAKRIGMLHPVGTESCAFVHDKIQQAAYALIGPKEKPQYHLAIARNLADRLQTDEGLGRHSTLIADQLAFALELLTVEEERVEAALVFYEAGKTSQRSSSFHAAAFYFETARNLLPRRCWRDHYDVSIKIFSCAAEVDYIVGQFDRTYLLIDEILENAQSFRDTWPASTTKIYALGTQTRYHEAIEFAFDVLKRLGEVFPKRAKAHHVRRSLEETQKILRTRDMSELYQLPFIHDGTKVAAMTLMNMIYAYTSWSPPHFEFSALIAMRMVQRSMQYGICGVSGMGFAALGHIYSMSSGMFDDAFRIGQVALRIVERFHAREWIARVHCMVYGLIASTKVAPGETLVPLLFGHEMGLQTGDTEFAFLNAHLYSANALIASVNLAQLHQQNVEFAQMMVDRKQDSVLCLHRPTLQCVANLMGEAENPLILTGQYMDEVASLKTNNGAAFELVYFWKGYIASILGLHGYAGTFFSKVEFKYISLLGQSMVAYLSGLACFSRALDASGFQRMRGIRTGRQRLERVRQFASSNPFFVHKVHLLEAKLALCCGKPEDARTEFAKAIEGAQRYNSLLDEALATEHAGVALLCENRPNSDGFRYVTNALLLYEQWGAQKKVEQMRRFYGFSTQDLERSSEEEMILPRPVGELNSKLNGSEKTASAATNGRVGVSCG